MSKRLREMGKQAAKGAGRGVAERRVVKPVARKVGGCATVVSVILFTALGVGAAVFVGRAGGDADAVGPVAVGIGLLAGIVFGGLVGAGVGRLLRRLL
jgi:hypothetical protein